MRIVIDCETNSLKSPTKIHCICTYDLDTQELKTFRHDLLPFVEYIKQASLVIGHNIIDYDWRVMSDLINPDCIPADKVVDTLILSKMHNYKQEGGHSLENWGELLDHPKVGLDISNWEVWTPEIEERCQNDVLLTAKVYRCLSGIFDGKGCEDAIRAEHALAFICLGMHVDGFGFDADRARHLLADLSQRVSDLDRELLDAFPPKAINLGEYTPRLTKRGTISRANLRWWGSNDFTQLSPECSFCRLGWESFNPASPSQIVERLDAAGWSPTVKTDSGNSWKVNEENLATLPDTAPAAARKLVLRIMLASRVRRLEEWLGLYNEETKSIHGKFVSIGTYTHRMAHQKPNMGNVSAEKSIKYKGQELRDEAIRLGAEMRSFWIARPRTILVGTDMDAAHLRIFAHLIQDDDLIEALENGKKDDGTDVHSVNQRKIGKFCTSRDLSKTCVYTFLNGGGSGKFSSVLGCSYEDAKRSLDQFISSYPGLQRLREREIPQLAKQGYFIGLDGRIVPCDSEHHMLACMLQNYEKVLMTHANIEWRRQARLQDIPFRQVNSVHDEWQTECLSQRRELAETLGRIQVQSLMDTGKRFSLRCPIRGNYTIGKNWLETH